MSSYEWTSNGTKDIPKKENDHAMDALRYMVMGCNRFDDSMKSLLRNGSVDCGENSGY